jgi:hypothetical protein
MADFVTGMSATNSDVIVRLDRAIRYPARSRFYSVRLRLLDARFCAYDEKCGYDEEKNDEDLK